eukprot:225722_1
MALGQENLLVADNFINGKFVPPSTNEYMDVVSPVTKKVIGKVAISGPEDVNRAVEAAQRAYETWGALTVKRRAAHLIKLHHLIGENSEKIAEIIMNEHGKNKLEALGSVAKGNETVEYAMSLPQLIAGRVLEVSGGVECKEIREPLGVCASVVPFNFPAMVPFWTLPICIGTGNCQILKPSEKVPLTMSFIATLVAQAGIPAGVFQIVNGTVPVVESLCDHPDIKALTFVGSSKVAEIVSKRCRSHNKRVLALGGANNHLVALPDCDREMTAQDIVNSYSGCTGQRCMAASVLLVVGDGMDDLLELIVDKSKALMPGTAPRQLGPVIDEASLKRIGRYVSEAEKGGAKILLDGRIWTEKFTDGYFFGPTVILHSNPNDPALKDEIFGPVLSVLRVPSREAALAHERADPHGNAAAVYTQSGESAQWMATRFQAAMVGVNIGVPVPREPFSFGGMGRSKFGDSDITGDGAIEFFTLRRKITTKWIVPKNRTWMD